MSLAKGTPGSVRAGGAEQLSVSEPHQGPSVLLLGLCLLIRTGDNYTPPVNNKPCELPVTLPSDHCIFTDSSGLLSMKIFLLKNCSSEEMKSLIIQSPVKAEN